MDQSKIIEHSLNQFLTTNNMTVCADGTIDHVIGGVVTKGNWKELATHLSHALGLTFQECTDFVTEFLSQKSRAVKTAITQDLYPKYVDGRHKEALVLHQQIVFSHKSDSRKCYYSEMYADGVLGFKIDPKTGKKEWIEATVRENLLLTHFTDEYMTFKKGEKPKKDNLVINQKICLQLDMFEPWGPPSEYCYNSWYLNNWQAPYWFLVQTNKLPAPKLTRPSVMPIIQALLAHLLPVPSHRNIALSWAYISVQPVRNYKALCLISSRGGVGKGLFAEHVLHSLHAGNYMSSEVSTFLGQSQFMGGSLKNKTLLAITEGKIRGTQVDKFKNFITTDYTTTEVKFSQAEETKQITNVVITSNEKDLFDNLGTSILRRIIVPYTTDEPIEPGVEVLLPDNTKFIFTQEDIVRIAKMSSNTQDAKEDAFEFAQYLQHFAASADYTDLNRDMELSGYLNEQDRFEISMRDLAQWKKTLITKYIIPHIRNKNPKSPYKHVEVVKGKKYYIMLKCHVAKMHAQAEQDMMFLAEYGTTKAFDMRALKEFLGENPYLSIIKRTKDRDFRVLISAEFIDAFEAEYLTVSTTPSTDPDDDPTPPGTKKSPESVSNQGIDEAPVKELCRHFMEGETTSSLATISNIELDVNTKLQESYIPASIFDLNSYAYIDFEYISGAKSNDLVCAVVQYLDREYSFWLHDGTDRTAFLNFLEALKASAVPLCAFACNAEARCLLSLGLNPLDFTWIDPYILGLPFAHSSDRYKSKVLKFAEGLDIDVTTYEDDEDDDDSDETLEDKVKQKKVNITGKSLLGMLYGFCDVGTTADFEEKRRMREVILSLPKSSPTRTDILSYCASDIAFLKTLVEKQLKIIRSLTQSTEVEVLKAHVEHSKAAVQIEIISFNGLPLNKVKLNEYLTSYPQKIEACFNATLDFYRVEEQYINRKGVLVPKKYTAGEAEFKSHLEAKGLAESWIKTEKGKYSKSKEAFKFVLDQIQGTDGKPDVALIPQLEPNLQDIALYYINKRQAKLLNIFGLKPAKDGKTMMSYISESDDGHLWQHPYYGPFGALTGRNASSSKSFLKLQYGHYADELITPPAGQVLVEADFSSQEVWIAAALSCDTNLMADVMTGQIYESFAKNVGLIPADGNAKTHPKQRNAAKQIILGKQFGMRPAAIALRAGITLEEAEGLDKAYDTRYANLVKFKTTVKYAHRSKRFTKNLNGWCLYDILNTKGNYIGQDKTLTIQNFPIQGMGAAILHKTLDYCFSHNLLVTYTVHDSIAILCAADEVEAQTKLLLECMDKACKYYFPNVPPCQAKITVKGESK